MTELSEQSTPLLLRDLMLEALHVRGDRLNALATELIGRLGDQAIHRLVLEAANRKNSVSHRLRILQAIAALGEITDPDILMDLASLMCDRNAVIRGVVVLLLERLRQGRSELEHRRGEGSP
jgi:hypothetical protein